MNTIEELKEYLDIQKMNFNQWVIVAICILIFTIDGFDILVMAFTAHSISQSWGLSGAQIGSLISSGLIGAAVGSFFIAPMGDKLGRRRIMMYSLYVASITMILSAYAETATQLGILRFITGVAIGGVLGNCNVLTSEYSSTKWRSLTVCLLSTGYALGATLGGILAIYLDKSFGWSSVFLIGGIATLIAAIITNLWLPESVYFLINKQPKGYQKELKKLQDRLKLPNISDIKPSVIDVGKNKSSIKSVFQKQYFSSTIFLWIAMFTMMFGFYYILTWTPKILSSSGMSNVEGISAGVIINFGAVIGTLIFGFLGAKYKIKPLQVIFLVLTALFTVVFAFSLQDLKLALLIGLIVGIFGVGSKAGIQVVAPQIYDSSNRATGVGLAIGIGRLGSMLSPIVAGLLLDFGWVPKSLFIFASLFFIVSMISLVLLKSKDKSENLVSTTISLKG